MLLETVHQSGADTINAIDAVAYIVSAIGTLAAVAASVWAAISARNDARQANARVVQLQTQFELQRRREQADTRAIDLAERGAAQVYITGRWTSTENAAQNSFAFSWFVASRINQQVRVVAARTVFPLVRHPTDPTPRDLLAEAGGEYHTNTVMQPTEHHAMASFARDPNISQPPPIEIEFVDHLDNRWRLSSARALTLLTPRIIIALPLSDATQPPAS